MTGDGPVQKMAGGHDCNRDGKLETDWNMLQEYFITEYVQKREERRVSDMKCQGENAVRMPLTDRRVE